MMTERNVAIPRFLGPQDNFLYWSAQIKAILNAKQVWHVMQVDDPASVSLSHQVRASDAGSDVCSAPERLRDVACTKILQGLDKVPFACVMHYQENPQQMRKFLHDWYSALAKFGKATVHTTLA